MTPLVAYLAEIRATLASGANTPETSFYPAVKGLLDAVGERLKPRVRCLMNLRNQGGGLPDGGLFTADQFGRDGEERDGRELLQATPERGAIEVKPIKWQMATLATSDQVTSYGQRYRHVLITNLREFWLVAHEGGRTKVLERFSLASSPEDFRALAESRERITKAEPALLEFLERVIRTPAPLAAAEDLAWFLASHAREALSGIEHAPVGALNDISDALGTALGVGFRGTRGRHFFNSTLVQTLFYGVFSAWVLWCQRVPRRPDERFAWKDTSDLLHLPILKVLFHEMTRPTELFTKVLRDRLDHAEATLARVDRAAFFSRFKEDEAVQYFYEPFLEAFDPDLRRELGVWYTRVEVVRYMVERVDRALRNELGIAEGLADPSVLVLDPACGTGAFPPGSARANWPVARAER